MWMSSDPLDDAKPDATVPEPGDQPVGADDDTVPHAGPAALDTRPLAAGPATPTPTRLGRYTIVKVLGSGGMGEVYRGHDGELDRGVAIKVLRYDRDLAGLEEALRREAQALAKLVHPNVITVYDVGSDRG